MNSGAPGKSVGFVGVGKAVGRSKGGLNTKIHAIVDGIGNPMDKSDVSFLAFVYLAAITTLLI